MKKLLLMVALLAIMSACVKNPESNVPTLDSLKMIDTTTVLVQDTVKLDTLRK